MAAEIAPRKIDENIGKRIRVIFGKTGNNWLLLLDKDDGDSQWQETDWTGLPTDLEKQLYNCEKKGRKITSVDFRCLTNDYGYTKTPWYIEGVKDGVPTHRWWGDTNASIENYKHSGDKVQVSFGEDEYDDATYAILEGNNGYCISQNVHSDLKEIVEKSNKEGAKIHFIRLFSNNQYFVSTNKSYSWSLKGEHLLKEIKKKGRVIDVARADDGSWIVIRPDYIVSSTGVDNRLDSKIHRFYTEQREYNRKRSQEITEFHNRKEREAREERERKERERAERVARERAERERVEREAREAAERAEREAREAAERAEREAREAAERAEREAREATERAQREALETAVSERVSSLEAKIEEKLLEEVKDIQETEKRLKQRKQSVLDVMQEMSPARRSRISFGVEETNGTKIICVICQDRSAQRAVVPCGHLCLCDSCSAANMELCPLCRGRVESTIKIYMGN